MMMPRPVIASLLALSLSIWSRSASAQTGVSDDRVSLPDGPGSMEGLGDSATVDPNMGMMHYEVPIDVPRGFPGVTPQLGLIYGSGNGSSTVGIGWELHVPSIERLTLRGLPRYDREDELAVDGGEQLVRISVRGNTALYRARFEGSFVRYTWHDAGAEGYFTAEYPDGSVGYFGADARGRLVPESRTSDAGRTFRYLLVERVDVHGHRLRYDYSLVSGVPLLSSVAYVHDAADVAIHRVELAYEERPDHVSDAKPGWEERLTRRLSGLSVFTRGERIRRYALSYEPEELAGGLSRLARVESFGRDDTRYPVVFSFGYSRALGGVCSTGRCERPFVVDMGTLSTGIQIGTGDATLVDLNGDALPDLVDASAPGAHRIFLNTLGADGQAHFAPSPRLSDLGTRSAFPLSASHVQVFDVDGDGFADLTNSLTRRVLCNDGTGDWVSEGCALGEGLGVTLDPDTSTPGDPNPLGVRFLDVDNDRRVDLLNTPGGSTVLVRRNTGSGFEELRGEALDREFDRDRLVLADMNGDGLLDPTEVDDSGIVRYRLHLGRARWSADWLAMQGPSVARSELEEVALEDLNADGLDDLVLVVGAEVRYALNRSGVRFDPFQTVTRDDLDGDESLPVRSEFTTVVYADMNGNGSRDIVWIEASGQVRYLELFPVRPNLLSRIENGIGSVQEIHYGTASAQRQADDSPWLYPLGQAVNVVERLDSWVTLTGGEQGEGLHEVTDFRYRDGFYDGAEKAFRGFARVEAITPRTSASDSQEAGRTVREFDVGAVDPYFHGRETRVSSYSGDGPAERALEEQRISHADCDVAGLPTSELLFDVRFVCETKRLTILREGAPESEWATLEEERTYDGYGDVIVAANLGVVHMGAPESRQACAPCRDAKEAFGTPCGPSCTGDERYVATEYVVPGPQTGERYLLGRPHTVQRYGREGGVRTDERTYYDGQAFTGLALGRLTHGNVSRVTARVREGADAIIEVARRAFDDHGNVTIEIDANGSPADASTHRRSYQYDRTGLRVVRTDVHLVDEAGAPYLLRREYSYDPAFDELAEATRFMTVRGDGTSSVRHATRYRYDEFGRRIAIIEPGDTDEAPTVAYAWELANPASQVRIRMRSARGEAVDLDAVRCMDGLGREFQRRTGLDRNGETYQVSGFAELNARGAPIRVFQPYTSSSAECDRAAPASVLHEDTFYDAAERELMRVFPDASTYGSASFVEHRYTPLAVAVFDEEDTNQEGPHTGTPTVRRLDGLGRVVAVERIATRGEPGAITSVEYDPLGRVQSLFDASGHEKRQRHDLLGRLLEIEDPNSGLTTFVHDPVGNVTARTDARGVTTRTAFDGANRIIALWNEADRPGTEMRSRYDFSGACDPSDCANAPGHLVESSYPLPAFLQARIGGGARGVDRFGFDARGQTTFESRTLGGVEYRTVHTRDNVGRVVDVLHPDGSHTRNEYDGLSRVVAIAGIVEQVERDARGFVAAVSLTNGAEDRWSRDERGRVSGFSTRNAAGDLLQNIVYGRNRVGDVQSLVDDAQPPSGFDPLQLAFSHDAWRRLVESRNSAPAEPRSLSFSYDALDNLVGITQRDSETSGEQLSSIAYDQDRPNAAVRAGELAYGYDESGQVERRGELDLRWDHEGRLTEVTRGEQHVLSMAYGPGTSRVATVSGSGTTLYVSGDFEIRDGIGVRYTRLDRRRVARSTSYGMAAGLLGDGAPVGAPDGVVTAADAWVVHVADRPVADGVRASDRAATMLRSAARRLLADADAGPVMLHSDHLESLTLATDVHGEERGRRRYRMPTGEERSVGFVDSYGFSGQEELPGLGWVRFQYRWLDPTVMRWTRPDPMFQAVEHLDPLRAGEAADPYAYVGNGFANAVDPTGLMLRSGAGGGADSHSDGPRRSTRTRREAPPPPPTHPTDVTKAGFATETSIRFDDTWRDQANEIYENRPTGQTAIVYVLYDGDVAIKVGKSTTEAFRSRFAEYADARGGGRIRADLYIFRLEADHFTVEKYEGRLRADMLRDGETLPADNSGTDDGPGFQNYLAENRDPL